MLAEDVRKAVIRYEPNASFTHAFLHFEDGSYLEFEHSSRASRWARASTAGTAADKTCLALQQFRLNAKHLQLFFEDGSNVEFFDPRALR
jgi:hypothetical protein